MTSKQFRKQYLLSLGLTFLAVLMFLSAVLIFLFTSSNTLINDVSSTSNPDILAQAIMDIIMHLLVNSFYAIFSLVLYWVGVVWNVVVAVKRSKTQNSNHLTIIVVVGWVASIFLPLVGLIVSFVAQIWGWLKGSKDNAILAVTS